MKKLKLLSQRISNGASSRKVFFSVPSMSNTKVRKIELGFESEVRQSRDSYLSKELEKYKNIKVVID